jgi:hypothetical protein
MTDQVLHDLNLVERLCNHVVEADSHAQTPYAQVSVNSTPPVALKPDDARVAKEFSTALRACRKMRWTNSGLPRNVSKMKPDRLQTKPPTFS